MALNSLNKSANFAQSSGIRKQKELHVAKITQIYSDQLENSFHNKILNKSDISLKNRVKKHLNSVTKVVKIASTQKLAPLNNSSLQASLHSGFAETSFLGLKKSNLEGFLLNKMAKEKDFSKKFDIVVSTAEKLTNIDRNFSIFYKVIQEFLLQYKGFLFEKNDQFHVDDNEKSYRALKNSFDQLFREFTALSAENTGFKAEFEKIREENGKLKFQIKRYADFLKKLQNNGIPVEKMYQDVYGPSKSKLLHKLELKLNKASSEKDLKQQKTQVPKLNLLGNSNEDYQEEFMSKFNEFSESWRKQIIKDHQNLNS